MILILLLLTNCTEKPTSKPLSYNGLAIAGVCGHKVRAKDDSTFRYRARAAEQRYGLIYQEVSTGQKLIRTLIHQTQQRHALGHIVIFAHGDTMAIVLEHTEGFYRNPAKDNPTLAKIYGGGNNDAFMSELFEAIEKQQIIFRPGAILFLLSCGSATFAEELTTQTGISTVGAWQKCGPYLTPDSSGKESGLYLTDHAFIHYRKVNGFLVRDTLGELLDLDPYMGICPFR